MTQITFLGAGAMGSRMIANLLRAGFEVTVWNRSEAPLALLAEAGARIAPTAAAAVSAADVVISMLTDDEASRDVWLDRDAAAIAGLRGDTTAIECSSISPAWSLQLAAALRSNDTAYIEAPVVGSRPQAETAQLVHLVGAAAEDLEPVRSVLEVSAAAIRHVGPVGTGMAAKLAVNALFAIQVSAFGEVSNALQGAGLSTDEVTELFASLPVTSPALAGIGRLIVAADDDPRFPIDLVAKDLRYFAELADPAIDWPLAAATRARFDAAAAAGLGGRNINAVVRLPN